MRNPRAVEPEEYALRCDLRFHRSSDFRRRGEWLRVTGTVPGSTYRFAADVLIPDDLLAAAHSALDAEAPLFAHKRELLMCAGLFIKPVIKSIDRHKRRHPNN